MQKDALIGNVAVNVPQTALLDIVTRVVGRKHKSLPIGPVLRWLAKAIAFLEDRYGAKYFGLYLRAGKT